MTSKDVEKSKIDELDFSISLLEWHPSIPEEFSDLKIAIQPGFHPGNLKLGRIMSTLYTYKDIFLDGNKYFFAGREDTLETNPQNKAINLYLGRDDSYANLTIEINEEEECIYVEAAIVRHDKLRSLKHGIGTFLWQKAIVYYQELATNSGKKIVATVSKRPGHGGVSMTPDEWDRIFIPRLNQMNFEKITDNLYTKTFLPVLPIEDKH